jgi:hypothetical protein
VLPEEVVTALATGEPERLAGLPETRQVLFRSEPYALATDVGRMDLGKDVADLASQAGGVIVVGVRAAGDSAELNPRPASMLDADRHQCVIREHVTPSVEVDVAYFPAPHYARHGYLSIQVRPLGRRADARQPGARYRPM